MKKERVDVLCVEQGLFDSREKAKRAIMAGIVRDDYDYIQNGREQNTIHITSQDGYSLSKKEVVLTNHDYPADIIARHRSRCRNCS